MLCNYVVGTFPGKQGCMQALAGQAPSSQGSLLRTSGRRTTIKYTMTFFKAKKMHKIAKTVASLKQCSLSYQL
jgi:hypothetical protein